MDMIRCAEFSEDEKYRFWLSRAWEPQDAAKPLMGLVGKNPSYANQEEDDPTIIREIALAKREGCRGLVKVNLFDYVATKSQDLVALTDAERSSEQNSVDRIVAILRAHGCHPIVCCWGTHKKRLFQRSILQRGEMVRLKLVEAGIEPKCLDINKDRSPRHPLYLPADLELKPYFGV
jgi:hypothetical protein